MALFDSDPQFREKETLRRFFSLLPLWGGLAGGRIFRWFAVNIPMSLAGDPRFTSDLDVGRDLTFDNGGETVRSSLTDSQYTLSMFRFVGD